MPDDTAPPPGPPVDPAVPSAQPGDQNPGQTAAEAAGQPLPPGAAQGLPQEPVPAAADAQADAKRFLTANLGDFDGKLNMTHMPNVDRIVAPDGMKAALLQVADDNKDAIDAARRGTITNDQLVALAQDFALNTDMVKLVGSRELGTQFERPEVVLAARMVGTNQLFQAQAAAAPLMNGSTASPDIVDYFRQKNAFLSYWTQLMGARAEQGRGLNAFSIPAPNTLPPEVMDHIADLLKRQYPNLQAEVTALKMALTPVGMANILSGSLATRIGKASWSLLSRIFVNGILSGPPTWAKIFVGNNYNLLQNTGDIFAAGMTRRTIGLAQRMMRMPTADESAQMSDAYTFTHGVISGSMDAFRLAGRALRTGVSLDGVLKFDPSEVSGVKNVNPALGPTQSILPEIQGTWFGSLAKGIDNFIDFPGQRMIGSIDEFTKTLGARGYRTMMTMREIQSKLQDGSLKPGDEGVIAKQMFENPSPEMLQAEEDYAHRMTFQSPFPPGSGAADFQNLVNNRIPALKFVFPFMRTAINIFKQSTLERTPLGLLSSKLRNQLAAGGAEADIARTRMATGSAFAGGVAWMAAHDMITGDAPRDPKERALWATEGRQPYSIRIPGKNGDPDTWRSYAWMEPVASIAGITADSMTAFRRINQDEQLDSLKDPSAIYADMIGHIAGAVITNTANKTFMTGAAKFSEMFSDPEHGFNGWAQDFGTSLVPYSKAIEFTRNVNDPFLREAWSLHDKLANDMPSIIGEHAPFVHEGSKDLGVAVDLFGNPRTHGGPFGRMSPFPSSPAGEDDVTDELNALMDHTQQVPFGMPPHTVAIGGGASGRGIVGGTGMQLTSQEYSEMVQKGRNEPVFDGNTLNLHDKLRQIMGTPMYMNSTPAGRSATLALYANKADQIGRVRLFKENEDFRNRMIQWDMEKNALKSPINVDEGYK